MTQINYWLKAPEWANAVIASKDGQEFYVSQFGGISARQRVGYSEVDHDLSADMIEPHNWSLIATRQTPWTGEGRPPVGTVCEFHGSGAACPYDPWHPDLKDGDHVTIIAYFNDSVGEIAAFTFKARNENIAAIQVEQARPGAFRPIRTPAQLAAEEREKAIEFMMQMTSSLGHSDVSKKILFGELYDKGLRFEVKP